MDEYQGGCSDRGASKISSATASRHPLNRFGPTVMARTCCCLAEGGLCTRNVAQYLLARAFLLDLVQACNVFSDFESENRSRLAKRSNPTIKSVAKTLLGGKIWYMRTRMHLKSHKEAEDSKFYFRKAPRGKAKHHIFFF